MFLECASVGISVIYYIPDTKKNRCEYEKLDDSHPYIQAAVL